MAQIFQESNQPVPKLRPKEKETISLDYSRAKAPPPPGLQQSCCSESWVGWIGSPEGLKIACEAGPELVPQLPVALHGLLGRFHAVIG